MDLTARALHDGRNIWYGEGTIDTNGKIVWKVRGGTGEGSAENNPTTLEEIYKMLALKVEGYNPSSIEINMYPNRR